MSIVHNKNIRIGLIVMASLAVLIIGVYACFVMTQTKDRLYQNVEVPAWVINDTSITAQRLIEDARNHSTEDPRKALELYSIVEHWYETDKNPQMAEYAVEALIGKWQVYFYHYFDFAESFSALLQAEDIAGEHGVKNPGIDLSLGIFYQTMSDIGHDSVAARDATVHYRKAFATALDNEDSSVIDVIASNAILDASVSGGFESVDTLYKRYQTYPYFSDSIKRHYNILLYEGLRAQKESDYNRSIMILDSLIAYLPEQEEYLRYTIMSYLHKSNVYETMGHYGKAVETLRIPLGIAERKNIKDILSEIYQALGESLSKEGSYEEAREYAFRALALRDSILSHSHSVRVNEVLANRNIERYRMQLTRSESEKEAQRHVMIIISVSFLIAMGLLGVIFNQNHKLRQSSKALYGKNVDLLRESDNDRRRREEYDRRIERLTEQIQQYEAERASQIDLHVHVSGDDANHERYRNSNLDEDQKYQLMDDIMRAMDGTAEYLAPDFSLEKLASMSGSNYKHVSQAINEVWGGNFNSFINGYRIREACRRIDDRGKYGSLTLDAISETVGFRARSTFVSAFKKHTGLTPSKYQEMARSKDKESHNKDIIN